MRRLIFAVCGPLIITACSNSSSSTPTSPTSSVQSTWQPQLGGAVWLNSRYVHKQVATAVSQYSRPVLVAIKADQRGFGYRFDLDRETGAYDNPTVYGFGYLRQAHTQCYWSRPGKHPSRSS